MESRLVADDEFVARDAEVDPDVERDTGAAMPMRQFDQHAATDDAFEEALQFGSLLVNDAVQCLRSPDFPVRNLHGKDHGGPFPACAGESPRSLP